MCVQLNGGVAALLRKLQTTRVNSYGELKVPIANIRSLAHIRGLHTWLSGSAVDDVVDFEKLNKNLRYTDRT